MEKADQRIAGRLKGKKNFGASPLFCSTAGPAKNNRKIKNQQYSPKDVKLVSVMYNDERSGLDIFAALNQHIQKECGGQ